MTGLFFRSEKNYNMIKITSLICLALSFSLYSNAQITWEKLFSKANTDVFRSIQEVPAGGYIAAGYTSWWSSNDTDAYVVRMTGLGDTLWTRSFHGGKKELFYKVINTSDGGFVMCGYTDSYSINGDQDAYYMKLDANGNQLWQYTYGGTQRERAQEIVQTADGGYAMCGYTNSGTGAQGYNAFLVKLNSDGTQAWNMKYGTNAYEDANSVKELPNGDFILAGQQSPGVLGAGDIWVVRTNSSGAQQWTQNIGTSENDNAEYIQLATAGGYIIGGSTNTLLSGDIGYLVKTNDMAVVQWAKTYGGDFSDDFHRVENTSDGGYIAVGTTQSNAAVISDEWLYKVDVNGDSMWARTYGGANHDHAYSAVQTSDGGYILCGYTASFGFNYEDAHVVKVDGAGLLYNHLIYTTVTALVSPVSAPCGNPNTVVTITVRNFGDTAQSVFPDTVIITGAIDDTLAQTFIGNISPANSANHTFSATINTSGGGIFNFHCFTSNNNDVYPAMNSFDATITLGAQAAPPIVTGDTTCGPGPVTLTASSPDALEWYDSATGGSMLGSGNTLNDNISSTTTYYVQATNACGTSVRVAVTAYVLPPTPPPNVFDGQRCGPGSVTLLAAAGNPISWWDSATGGTLLQGDTNSFIVNVTATTIFYVEAGTGSGCPSIRVSATATVNPLPVAAFTANAPAVCLGDAFQFTNLSTGAVGYDWDFGDASGTSVQPDPSYTYALAGNYIVQLVARTGQFCYDTTTLAVDVNTAPQVNFSISQASGCIPFTASFTNTTTNASNYLWNFGDGNSSTDQSPIHDYLTAGTFTVTLLATVGSCADSDSVVGMITTYAPPVFDFASDSIMTNSVMYELDAGPGFSYLWNNGSTAQTITADTNGWYCVTVTDNNTCSDSDCVYVVLDAMGMETAMLKNGFVVYPNPAREWFTVVNTGFTSSASCELKIYDSLGRMVLAQYIAESHRVETAGWQKGIYFVEITAGDNRFRKKVVVQ
jgi:PKD repeat protein